LKRVRDWVIVILDWFYAPFSRFLSLQTFRYAACGVANLVLDIFLYFLVYNFLYQKQLLDLGFVAISAHIAALFTVFPITFFTGFLFSKYITFTQSDVRGRIQIARYALSVGGSIILNYLFLKFFVEFCHFYPTPAKMATTVFVVTYSFFIQKKYTFKS